MRLLLLLPLLALCAAVPAGADSPHPPTRNGNVYGGFNHQPTRSEVESRERSEGLAPDAREQAAQNSTIRHLYEELEQEQRTD
jgi:hypothetical protein